MKDFQNLKEIGKGAYGQVFKGELHGKEYAIKTIKKKMTSKENSKIKFEKEIGETNRSPFLCRIDYVFEDEKKHYFVMPHLSGGTLFEKLG